MQQLVECVPNFSEGRDLAKISTITAHIEAIPGITLLDVDPGADTNRTVVTFVGPIEAVEDAAFQAIKSAGEVLDMRSHKGAHARMGATDVCPFIPVSGVSMDDCISLSKRVGKRVGEDLSIPVYLYENSAQTPKRKNLATIRSGEYEGLKDKLADPAWGPDFGPTEFHEQAGATVVGAREFLIAYNINLNTLDKRLATDIAFELREKGRAHRRQNPDSPNLLDGDIIRYEDGDYPCSLCDYVGDGPAEIVEHNNSEHGYDLEAVHRDRGYNSNDLVGRPVLKPGLFKDVKAVGWIIDEYGCAQISINFTNYHKSTIHDVFDMACKLAEERGLRVTGSELVGLIPLNALLMAGDHYLKKQRCTPGVPEARLVEVAVQSLGLNNVSSFVPKEKIIDYAVSDSSNKLAGMSVQDFADELSTNSVAPGGGSVAALVGGLGSGLVSMVAALTHEKKGFEDYRDEMEAMGIKAQTIKQQLTALVDEDTDAFNAVIEANRLPDSTKEEMTAKESALLAANKRAITVPLEVARLSHQVLELAVDLVNRGNPNSVSDVGVAGEVAYAGVRGGSLNVYINLPAVDSDQKFIVEVKKEVELLLQQATSLRDKIYTDSLNIINR